HFYQYVICEFLFCICIYTFFFFFFFFSSRRRHTRLQGDWSSDVCSSDLDQLLAGINIMTFLLAFKFNDEWRKDSLIVGCGDNARSEERRVGKECRSRWSTYH